MLLDVDLRDNVISIDNLEDYCRFFTVFPNFNFHKAASDPKFYGQLFSSSTASGASNITTKFPTTAPYSSTSKKSPLCN